MLALIRQCLAGLLFVLSLSSPVFAGTCFAVDDDSNTIITYDSDAPLNVRFTTTIANFAANNQIEAAYFDSVTNRYYVVRQSSPNQFGYVRPNDGIYVPVGTALGTANVPNVRAVGGGNSGSDRIVGLARNPTDNKWYVIDRSGYLYEINPVSGQFIPGAFNGNDYTRVRTPAGSTVTEVEDLAFDNAGNLYVLQNISSPNQFLRQVNLMTGLAQSALDLGINQAEGLSNSLGDIRVIIGGSANPGGGYVRSDFLSVNTETGALTRLFTVPNPTGVQADFEATGCNDGTPRADLRLSQSIQPSAVAPGGTATLVLRLEHEGIDRAFRIQVQSALPAGMSVLSSTLSGSCTLCSFDIPSGVWTVPQLDISRVQTLSLVVSTSGVTPNSVIQARAQISQVCDSATGSCMALSDVDSTPSAVFSADWQPAQDDEAVSTLLVTDLPSVGKHFVPNSGLAGDTALLVLTLTNPNTTSVATLTAALTDTYPTGMLNAATPAAATNCGGAGVIIANPGNNLVVPAGRVIPAGGSCTVSVAVTAASVGHYTNTIGTSALTVTVAGVTLSNVIGASATYEVSAANVGLIKDFRPDGIGAGQTSTLVLTLSNPRNVTATLLSDLVDLYPTDVVNAAAPNPQTNCTSASFTATVALGSATLAAGAQIPPNGSCTMTVVVTSSQLGTYTNVLGAGALSTSVGSNLGTASAILLVANPSVSKAFVPNVMQPGQTVTLRLTFTNPRGTTASMPAVFTDVYPSMGGATVVNAVTPNLSNGCSSVGTATASSNQLSMRSNLNPYSSCVVSVQVTVTPTTATGEFVNLIPAGSLTTSLGANLQTAVATLTVSPITNLAVSKQASHANAYPGTTISYTLTIANLGPSSAFNATFTDFAQGLVLSMPTIATLSTGASVTSIVHATSTALIGLVTTTNTRITATLTIPSSGFVTLTFQGQPALFNGFITNTASVQAGSTATDSNLANNTASVSTLLSPSAYLSVSKTNGTDTLIAGATTLYTVTFSNSGPSDASGAIIRDVASPGLTCQIGTCTGTNGAACGVPTLTALSSVGHALPSFPSGSSVTLIMQCNVTAIGLPP